MRLGAAEHQDLFASMNALLEAMYGLHGQGEVERLVGFLSSYVVHHFGAEEALLRRHPTPGRPRTSPSTTGSQPS